MADPTPKLYEGLFLMSQPAVSVGIGSAIDTVRGMLERAGAETITLSRWEERKLAYPIGNQKRGTYLLSLFKVAPVQIANIERDCNLSEDVLRVLMTRADYMGDTEIAEAIKAAETASGEADGRDEDAPAEGEAQAKAGAEEAAPEGAAPAGDSEGADSGGAEAVTEKVEA